MYRPGSATRPAFCQVILLTTDHFFLLKPATDSRRRGSDSRPGAGPERSSIRSHFEGVELQGERRQRQPQIIQFLGPRVVPVIHDECRRVRFSAGNIHRSHGGAPPAGTGGDIHATTSVSVDGDRPCRGCLGSRVRVLGNLMNHRQLQHGRALPFTELRHQHVTSIWKFDRIMVTMRDIRIYRAEFPDAEIDGFGPDPSVVVSDIFGECQFGPRKHADRYLGLLF
jgi:hypothetical protein